MMRFQQRATYYTQYHNRMCETVCCVYVCVGTQRLDAYETQLIMYA